MAVAGARPFNGRLSKGQHDQLVSFIGQGRKNFRLLYSARRDTCSPDAFHRHCDYKGPTVTVLYNPKDTVYGGYTSMSWTQAAGVYVSDPSAFLFQLKKDGISSVKKFPCSNMSASIFCNSKYAATFGNGHDLHLMTAPLTLNNSDAYTLDGHINFSSYNMQGVDEAGFCNDTLDVTEIEVYSITDNTADELDQADLLSKPWRATVDWTNLEGSDEALRLELERYVPIEEDLQGSNAEFPCSNILLMGPVGAGKSSFINTATSVFRKRIFNIARSGSADKSLTTKFTKYKIKTLKFKLCDSRGLEADNLMTKENMRFLLEGNLVDKMAFEPSKTINHDSPGFKRHPKLDEKIHCVAIFADAASIDSMTETMPEVTQNIKDMQTVMNSLDVPQVIILTKVDHVCQKSKENVSSTYRSRKVEQCVAKVSEMFGIPRNQVFPMKNYENEGCVVEAVNILTMYTIKMILGHADAFLYTHCDEIIEDYRNKSKKSGRQTDFESRQTDSE